MLLGSGRITFNLVNFPFSYRPVDGLRLLLTKWIPGRRRFVRPEIDVWEKYLENPWDYDKILGVYDRRVRLEFDKMVFMRASRAF